MWSWAGWGGGLTWPPNYTPHWGSLCRSWGHIKYPFILALITRSSPKAATCLWGVGVERRSHSEETSIANQTALSSFSLACPVGLTPPTALQLILSRSSFLQVFIWISQTWVQIWTFLFFFCLVWWPSKAETAVWEATDICPGNIIKPEGCSDEFFKVQLNSVNQFQDGQQSSNILSSSSSFINVQQTGFFGGGDWAGKTILKYLTQLS